MNQPIEIHLQEGFRGEPVIIQLDDVVVARLTPKTRLQLGLAHIERLDAAAGQMLRIHLPDRLITAEHPLRANDHFLVVYVKENALTINSVPGEPGYV